MRRSLSLMLITLIILALPSLSTKATIEALPQTTPALEVERDVEIRNAGIVLITDTFTLEGPSGVEIALTGFWTGFHEAFNNERRSFEVWHESAWTPLDYVETQEEGFPGYVVKVPDSITLDDNAVRIRSSYLFLESVKDIGNLFEALIPVYPIVQYNISSFKIRVELPPEAVFDDAYDFKFNYSNSEGIWVLEQESEAVDSYSTANATIQYIPHPDDEYLLDCQKMERKILVQSSAVRVEDSYSLINRGERITRLTLQLPTGASNVKARDGVGTLKISTTEQGEDGSVEAHVTPRSVFRPNDRWVFTIIYSLSKGDYVISEGGRTTLKCPLDDFIQYIRELSAVITLPEGGRLIASQPEPSATEKVGYQTDVSFDLGSSLPSERPEIVAELSLSPFSSVVRWIGLMVVAAGAIGSVYVLRRRGKVEVSKIPVVVERPKLFDFFEQHRERIALFSELEELQRSLDDNEIDRDRYNLRSAEINRGVEELTRSLRRLGRDLEAESPDLRERLVDVKRIEEELDRLKNDLRNLDVRLRARRVTRRDFERRRSDRLRRRSQAIRRLEQALASLGNKG